jgi:hypothetical protein
MFKFLLLIVIGMVCLWFGKQNMFWEMLGVLAVTWLVIGSGIAASVLIRSFFYWIVGVYA